MNTTPQNQQMNPDEARSALEQASAARVASPRDRSVYAIGTAFFGIVLGIFLAVTHVYDGARSSGVIAGFYVVAMLGIAAWQRQRARSVPRGAKRTGYLGLGLSVLLVLVVNMGLNWSEQTTDSSAWLLACAALLVALPMLVAAAVIQRTTTGVVGEAGRS